MDRRLVLPYDGSPVARAVLRRAARLVGDGKGQHAGVVLATAGVDPEALGSVAAEAQAVAGPDVPLEVRLLCPGDPIGALRQLVDSVPGACLAAPLGAIGNAPWYAEACRHTGTGRNRVILLFFLEPAEVRAFVGCHDQPHQNAGLIGIVLRAGARLRRTLRAPAEAVRAWRFDREDAGRTWRHTTPSSRADSGPAGGTGPLRQSKQP